MYERARRQDTLIARNPGEIPIAEGLTLLPPVQDVKRRLRA